MRRPFLVSAFVASTLATASCTASRGATTLRSDEPPISCTTLSTSGLDVEEIRRLEHLGAQSNVEGWSIEEARAFFAPEWIAVSPDGNNMDLNAVFSGFENGRSRPWAGRFDILDLEVRVYCDVAVVVGRAAAYPVGASGPEHRPATHFRWLNVWRKQDGRWVYVANQFTRY